MNQQELKWLSVLAAIFSFLIVVATTVLVPGVDMVASPAYSLMVYAAVIVTTSVFLLYAVHNWRYFTRLFTEGPYPDGNKEGQS